MLDNIVIGQYIPGTSWIYKLDPRIKIVGSILLIVALFLVPNLYVLLGFLAVFLIGFITTGISLIKLIKGLSGLLFLLVFTFLLQLFYSTDGPLLTTWHFQISWYHILMFVGLFLLFLLTRKYILHKVLYFFFLVVVAFVLQAVVHFDTSLMHYNALIYQQGLEKASFVFIRIVIMIGITTLLTFSTMSTELNTGLYYLLKPLKYIKVPVGVISMMFSLTLRFIPTLLEETKKIIKAQASRGIDFANGKLKDRVVQIISLLIPMFVVSFKRAEELADAMEARGYVIDAPRTELNVLKLRYYDYIGLVVLFGILGAAIYLNVIF